MATFHDEIILCTCVSAVCSHEVGRELISQHHFDAVWYSKAKHNWLSSYRLTLVSCDEPRGRDPLVAVLATPLPKTPAVSMTRGSGTRRQPFRRSPHHRPHGHNFDDPWVSCPPAAASALPARLPFWWPTDQCPAGHHFDDPLVAVPLSCQDSNTMVAISFCSLWLTCRSPSPRPASSSVSLTPLSPNHWSQARWCTDLWPVNTPVAVLLTCQSATHWSAGLQAFSHHLVYPTVSERWIQVIFPTKINNNLPYNLVVLYSHIYILQWLYIFSLVNKS